MTGSEHSRLRQLDLLITGIASDLMGVPESAATEAMERTLAELLDFFSVDQTFLRRNRHEAGTSLLMAEWPRREVIPVPDPLYEVPYTADPVFGMVADLKEPVITYPDDSPDYRDRVKAGSGEDEMTMAMVPLTRGEETMGVLGLARFNADRWAEDEVTTLAAIASLIAQMWGRHDAEAAIARQAFYDDLTGLPNRRLLEREMEDLSASGPLSVAILDVDNMKVINDGLNHDAGDQFLVAMGERLQQSVRQGTMVARLDGDQFAVLVSASEASNVEAMARRLVEAMGAPYQVGGVSVARSVSIGLAHLDPDRDGPRSPAELLREADAAMYDAKRNGKNRLAVFTEEIQLRIARSFQTELELRQGIEAGDQICLYYQPEVDLRTGWVVAVEALMRWQHPERGLLAAGAFIQVAEESGLIVEIGDQVLSQAVAQLARWQDQNPELTMRVNVSPAQLMSRDLAGQIRMLVAKHGVNPERLCIEVTEHVMIADHEFTLKILSEIRAMGVQIALDDFGTGYSSLEQLKRLPIDAIKIDRAFMIELATSHRDAAIVDAAIVLANALGLSTVAEGIEEEDQVLELLNRGCYRAQGFLLARPAPPEEVAQLFGEPIVAGRLKLSELAAARHLTP